MDYVAGLKKVIFHLQPLFCGQRVGVGSRFLIEVESVLMMGQNITGPDFKLL